MLCEPSRKDLPERFLAARDGPLINLFAKVMDTVGEAVRDGAQNGRRFGSATHGPLTIFFVGPFGLAAMQIGRNLAVYRTRGGRLEWFLM